MARDRTKRRMRKWYAVLLRLYPERFREQFAEQMEQTFNDLLRERENEGKGLAGFAAWLFADTFSGAMREIMTNLSARQIALARVALVTASILLLPLIAMRFTDEVAWTVGDFIVAGVLLLGAGLTYELITAKGQDVAYRFAVGVAVFGALLLIWVNLAVGIIGDEGNPANLMYLGVLAVGIVGTFTARLRPAGMSRALFAMSLAQAAIAVIVIVAGLDARAMAVVAMNGIFVALFSGSALLFRLTANHVD